MERKEKERREKEHREQERQEKQERRDRERKDRHHRRREEDRADRSVNWFSSFISGGCPKCPPGGNGVAPTPNLQWSNFVLCSSFAPTMADSLRLLNVDDVSWGDQVELPDVSVNDVTAAAADAVPVNAVPVNNADPVNDVRVNPAGSVNDVRFNPDDVNAVANAVQDVDVPANSEGGNAARAKPGKKFSNAGILVKNIP